MLTCCKHVSLNVFIQNVISAVSEVTSVVNISLGCTHAYISLFCPLANKDQDTGQITKIKS